MENDEMNKNELQALLDEEGAEGKTELEAYRKAMRVLGVFWRFKPDDAETVNNTEVLEQPTS